ncbi:hypothetical protein [Streptomyces sp. NPDC090445]|uniref:hypothetical protein n=1 Tax=Streptomyces sp. NPDC090445 TaxID=3365963 RepID=UPI003806B3F7
MELAHPLDGLDAQPWSAVSHPHGSAADLPRLLRTLAGDDEAAAQEALSDLYECLLHQGNVHGASAQAVPFLARMAAAGHWTADVLVLLGGLAESEDEHDVAPGAVRAAVAGQVPLLLPRLAAACPATRQAAAWAAAHTRDAAAVLPALRERWRREDVPLVRAELLGGISRLDPQLGAALAETVLGPRNPGELRLAALFACLDAGLPWTTAHHTTLLSLLPAEPLMAHRLDQQRSEPLWAVAQELLRRDTEEDRDAVTALLDSALRDERTEVRSGALWAAGEACRFSRGVPRRLLPALAPLAADADAGRDVRTLLSRLGTAAAAAAPALAAAARRNPDRAGPRTRG